MGVGVGSRSKGSDTVNAEIAPSGSVPIATVGCGVAVGIGVEVGVGVGGTGVAVGVAVGVGGIDVAVAVGGGCVGVGGTGVAVGVGVGGRGVGAGTRVGVAGTEVGGGCCASTVAVGAVVGESIVGVVVLPEVQPDTTVSRIGPSTEITKPERICIDESVFTENETTRKWRLVCECHHADLKVIMLLALDMF